MNHRLNLMIKSTRSLKHSQLFILVFSAILIQLCSRYYAYNESLIIFGKFFLLIFLLRFGVPLIVNWLVLGLKPSELGLCLPKLSRGWKIFLLVYLILTPAVVAIILTDQSYIQYYANYANDQISAGQRLLSFALFTSSTFFAWEFLHRSYLLFGIKNLMQKFFSQNEKQSEVVAIAWVACFEVIYHFIKPDLEAWGFLLASPIFSWMAFRTKSMLIPMLCHFYIEVLFICYIVFLSR